MSKHKKKAKKAVSSPEPLLTEPTKAVSFGYEEMLSELEAIVSEAEIRIQDEENTACTATFGNSKTPCLAYPAQGVFA